MALNYLAALNAKPAAPSHVHSPHK